jgi:hypothetical protein
MRSGDVLERRLRRSVAFESESDKLISEVAGRRSGDEPEGPPPPLPRSRWTRCLLLRRDRVRSPVAVELADVGRVRDLEEAAPVRVDCVDVALVVICVASERDLLPVRRPDRVEALALAGELELDPPPRALGFRGGSRACLGDRDGLVDMRRALELALEQGKGRDAAVIYANLSTELFQYDGPQAALDMCLEGKEFSERRGIAGFATSLEGGSTGYLLDLGRVDEALE